MVKTTQPQSDSHAAPQLDARAQQLRQALSDLLSQRGYPQDAAHSFGAYLTTTFQMDASVYGNEAEFDAESAEHIESVAIDLAKDVENYRETGSPDASLGAISSESKYDSDRNLYFFTFHLRINGLVA